MHPSTPSDPSQQDPGADAGFQPEPDDADTGPLQTVSADEPQSTEPPRYDTWAGRFDAPLTVNPRQLRRSRNTGAFVTGAAAVGVVALVGGLIFWWTTRPEAESAESSTTDVTTTSAEPTADAEDQARLQRQLPKGYGADACAAGSPAKGVLAQVECEQNVDAGGPSSATYALAGDQSAVDAIFAAEMATATRVDCPGNIQSPGPWRRNATPDKVSGQLFCGLRDGQPTVVWTDADRMVVSAVRAGPQGPTFPQLYAWWSSHS